MPNAHFWAHEAAAVWVVCALLVKEAGLLGLAPGLRRTKILGFFFCAGLGLGVGFSRGRRLLLLQISIII